MKPTILFMSVGALSLILGIAAANHVNQETVQDDKKDTQVPQLSQANPDLEVGQKDKQFTQEKLSIKVGDSVTFTNDDPFFHNVFSLSPAATFDLGSYPQGESKSVTFDEPGEVHIECAIHPSMQMVIEVEE